MQAASLIDENGARVHRLPCMNSLFAVCCSFAKRRTRAMMWDTDRGARFDKSLGLVSRYFPETR